MGKGGRCVGLTTLPPSCADCHKIGEPQARGNRRTGPGLYRDCFTCYIYLKLIQVAALSKAWPLACCNRGFGSRLGHGYFGSIRSDSKTTIRTTHFADENHEHSVNFNNKFEIFPRISPDFLRKCVDSVLPGLQKCTQYTGTSVEI